MSSMNTYQEEDLRILVFDGGGIRGLSSLIILRNILYRIQQAKRLDTMPLPCEIFPMITGTSTGGLFALMLGRLRMSIVEAIEAYQQLATGVFSEVKRSGNGKFKATSLERAIRAIVRLKTGDEDTLLMDHNERPCHVFVCGMNSMNMDAGIPQLFRTYPTQHEEPMRTCTIWQATRATTATPAFFKPIQIGTQWFIDGGMGNNNPTLVTLDEAERAFPGKRISCILSLGTGKGDTICIPKTPSLYQRLLPLEVVKAIQRIATDCESIHEQTAHRFKDHPSIYFRFNVEQGLQNVALSEWEKLDIVEAQSRQYLKLQDVEFRLLKLTEVVIKSLARTQETRGTAKLSQIDAPGYRECPPPSPIFTGRRDILEKMHEAFSDIGKRHVYLLYGLGGSGKSQIAYKFVSESQVHNRFSETFFIDASTEATIRTSFESISGAKELGKTMNDALWWLQNRRSHGDEWLLLFNNADDTTFNLSEYFPKCEHGNILITSRNHELLEHAPNASQYISNMNEGDARDLLLFGLREKDVDTAGTIVSELHYLALAIIQARAYIQKCCPLPKFLDIYHRNREAILKAHPKQRSDDYEHTVYTTWEMSFQELSHRAASFLDIVSFMHHEGLTEAVFSNSVLNSSDVLPDFRRSDKNWDTHAFHVVLEELLSFSLVEHDRSNDSISVHPLVHFWSRDRVKDKFSTCQKTQRILGFSTRWEFMAGDYAQRRMLLPHVQQALEHGTQVDGSLLSIFALIYDENGLYKKAEKLSAAVTEKRKRLLGEEHPETLTSMASLAATRRKLGHWKDAEEVEVMVMETRKRVLGYEDPDTLASMANLAATRRNMGQWREAKQLVAEVMETRKRLLGDKHPVTLSSMADLALTHRDLGQWKEAEALQVPVLETRMQLLGDEHPDTLTSMANVAATRRKLGQWNEAEQLQVIVLEARKRVLGDEHPDTLNSMANLSATRRKLGQWREAEQLQVVVLETRKRVLGDEHPDTLKSMANVAATFRKLGQWKEAEQLQVVVLEARTRVLGGEHPDTLNSMASLARTRRHLGRLKEAKELELVVLETSKQMLGDEHPDTLTRMANLALTHRDLGQWKLVEQLQVVVLDTRKRVLGDEHPDTLKSMADLALTRGELGRWKEAKQLGVEVMEIRKRLLGDEHPDTLTSMGQLQVVVLEARKRVLGDEHHDTLNSMANVASTRRKLGQWKEAEQLEVLVLETRKRVLGGEHPDTLTSMASLACTRRYLGRLNEAEKLDMAVFEARKQVLGDEHPDTLTSINNLALTRRSLGQWKEAEQLQIAVLETIKKVLGKEHPATLSGMANLATTRWTMGMWKEAEELEVTVMQRRKGVLGDEHPDTLSSMASLAETRRNLGLLKEAEELEVAVLRTRIHVLGDKHPDTLISMNNLAQNLRGQGKPEEAEKLESQVMERMVRDEANEEQSEFEGTDSDAETAVECESSSDIYVDVHVSRS